MQKMLQLRLNDSFNVPVFELEGYKETYCLLDTGATMAVWCSGTGYLQEVFRNAVPTGSQVLLSGFGGSGEFAEVYKIPLLELRAKDNCISFRNVYTAVLSRSRFGFDMLQCPESADLLTEGYVFISDQNEKIHTPGSRYIKR